jgi:hypothetical protein
MLSELPANLRRMSLITPSYGPDFQRCRLLCESVDRFARNATHYVVVDRRDEQLFASLKSPLRRIITAESLLPRWIFRLPGAKRWWMSLRTRPIRNWIFQQLVKLSMSEAVDAELMVYVDSDVTFVRPFGPERFVRDGRVRLNRVTYENAEHRVWLEVAANVLGGVAPADIPPAANYVASLVTWRRSILQQMHRRISEHTGRHWVQTMASQRAFSEYMVYGLYVEKVLGYEAAGHVPMDSPMLRLSWKHDLTNDAGVDRFLQRIRQDDIGVMIHSKDAIPLDRYAAKLRQRWDELARSAAHAEPTLAHSAVSPVA